MPESRAPKLTPEQREKRRGTPLSERIVGLLDLAHDVIALEAERDALAEECMRHQVGQSYEVGHEHGSAVAARYKTERDEAVHDADMQRLAYMAADAEARRTERDRAALEAVARRLLDGWVVFDAADGTRRWNRQKVVFGYCSDPLSPEEARILDLLREPRET